MARLKGSVAKDVAARLGIKHRYCDPSLDDRASLGIRSDEEIKRELSLPTWLHDKELAVLDAEKAKDWPKRERFWLAKVQQENVETCIFILGAQHIDSFSSLLIDHGVKVDIEQRRWDVGG